MSSLRDLTPEQFQKYYEIRLEGRLRKNGASWMAKCIFHQDDKPSMAVRLDKGVWHCHGCGKGGGVLDMEMLAAGDRDTQAAIARIANIIGLPQLKIGGGPEAVYQYRDPQGKEVFQVVRFPNKKFLQRRRNENGTWNWKTSDLAMVLYNLPEVIRAKEILIVEGEKDADRLMEVLEAAGRRPDIAATTSPRGAGKWQSVFNSYFTGKKVVILPDNDTPGMLHAKQIATSIKPYAYGIKIPKLSAGKDVSDYLLGGKTLADLGQEIKATPQWTPETSDSIFSTYQKFEDATPDAVEWLIEGVAEAGSNGMMVARPKAGKSIAIIDLAMALASGQPWLGFYVPERKRVALISREDNPVTTGRRARKLRGGRGIEKGSLEEWLWINTRAQSKELLLENSDEISQLITDLLKFKAQVVILDVMRVLHTEDENSNTDMQVVINILNRVRDATGATMILVHHSRKGETDSLTEMTRGASAIAGWCEWIAGIAVVDKDEWVRSMEIELKGAESPKKFYWKIEDDGAAGETFIRLSKMDDSYEPPKKSKKRKFREPGEEKDTDFKPF